MKRKNIKMNTKILHKIYRTKNVESYILIKKNLKLKNNFMKRKEWYRTLSE